MALVVKGEVAVQMQQIVVLTVQAVQQAHLEPLDACTFSIALAYLKKEVTL